MVALYGGAIPLQVICPDDGSCIQNDAKEKAHHNYSEVEVVFFCIWTQSYTVAIDE